MGAILGMGLSHYPGFIYPDDDMAMRVKQTILSPKVPAELKEPTNWPTPMQREWGNDEGTTFAARHREEYLGKVRLLRDQIDAFAPDFVLIFGDDQYENFKEDLVPPFCVYIFDETKTEPFRRSRGGPPKPNVWGEPFDHAFVTKGHPQGGRYLARRLIQEGFDIPYAYTTNLHHDGLGHAFINTLLYLDYNRRGWDYPVVPFHINAYGSNLVRGRGGSANLFSGTDADLDPPAPSPARLFDLGRAVARALAESPWRVVIIGSSSWSHAFLTAKHHYVYPDVQSDRKRFEELRNGDYLAWRTLDTETLENAGEHEIRNWIPMVGAMHELGQQPALCELVESYLMNSCKVVALFPPKDASGDALAQPASTVGA